MQPSRDTIHRFPATTITDAIPAALARLLLADGEGRYDAPITLVYAGEGHDPGEALASALEDIRAQCADHCCRPVGLVTDAVMRTDTGTRIWGTVSCEPGMRDGFPEAGSAGIMLEMEGEGKWLLTIRSHSQAT
jgi:hypothetical protein